MSLTNILLSGIIMIILDSIYLSNIGKRVFSPLIKNIQGSDLTINIYYAILCYLFLVFGLNYFIISQNKSLIDAFLLGILIYGVFETTSGAIFKNWKLIPSIIDTLWGGILFISVTYLTYNYNIFN